MLTPSPRPVWRRWRTFSPSVARRSAVSRSTALSCAMIRASTSRGGIAELEGHEALARGLLQVLHHALVAGVVGQDEQEVGVRLEHLAGLVDGEDAAVVGERMDQDDGVLARLDHLVEVADRAVADGAGERTVDPDRLVALDEVATHQVAAGQVLVAGHRDQVAGHGARRRWRAAAWPPCTRRSGSCRSRSGPSAGPAVARARRR